MEVFPRSVYLGLSVGRGDVLALLCGAVAKERISTATRLVVERVGVLNLKRGFL